MTHLEISTTTENPFNIAYPQKFNSEYINQESYHNSEDDNSTVVSPTMTWESSRRSSFSSLSSSNTTATLRHCKSLHCDKSVLYPTKKAAYERIEYLEEQMRLYKRSNNAIVKNMLSSIDCFLEQKHSKALMNDEDDKQHDLLSTDKNQLYTSSNTIKQALILEGQVGSTQATTTVEDKVNRLVQFVTQHLTKDATSGSCNSIPLTQIIENWIHHDGVTDHKQSTKQDLKNVVVPLLFATEKERLHNTRLVQALQRLSRQKYTACQTVKQASKLQSIHMQSRHQAEKQKLKNQCQAKIDASMEEQQEMEQVLDDMRREMEVMLEELDQVKQQRERYQQKSIRLEQDLKSTVSFGCPEDHEDSVLQNLLREAETRIDQLEADLEEQTFKITKLKQSSTKDLEIIKSRMSALHSQQVGALIAEKEELRSRLVKAERSSAELALLIEVEKKKVVAKSHDSELEHALRRMIAEKDGELAKARFELEKMQKHTDQIQSFAEKQMKLELKARIEEMESDLSSKFQKQFDTNQVLLTRELRDLSGQIVELEAELQGLERQHEQDMRLIENTKKGQWSAEEKLSQKKKEWSMREEELKMSILKSDQRIISLEKEALVLYGKNLEMVKHLGELES